MPVELAEDPHVSFWPSSPSAYPGIFVPGQSLVGASMAAATLSSGPAGTVTLNSAASAARSLTPDSPNEGGFYPDSPLAYPDLPYPDELTDGMLTAGTVDPAVLTAA